MILRNENVLYSNNIIYISLVKHIIVYFWNFIMQEEPSGFIGKSFHSHRSSVSIRPCQVFCKAKCSLLSKNPVSVFNLCIRSQQHHTLFGIRTQYPHFTFHGSDMHRCQIYAAHDLFSDQILRSVQSGNLRR